MKKVVLILSSMLAVSIIAALLLAVIPELREDDSIAVHPTQTVAADSKTTYPDPEETPKLGSTPSVEPAPEPASEPTPEPPTTRGFYSCIPDDVQESMRGISMPDGATVGFDDLAYLTIYFKNFNGEDETGHIVVAKELADEVLDIFEELYNIEYPIQSVRLIDEFNDKQTTELNSLDRASMGSNNTSAFCYRLISGSSTPSQHAYGRAIDLNPLINPYVTASGIVSPRNATAYADRSGGSLTDIERRAMIHKDDEVYSIFVSRGWQWGGEIWNGIYDYQHFQK